MAMLLLRGAQTVAELRARTARLHPFTPTGEVEAKLERLSAGSDALARELPRQSGQRETRWIHLAGSAEVERDLMAGFHLVGAAESPPASAPRAANPEISASPQVAERLERLEQVVAELTTAMAALRSRLGD